MKSTSVHQSQFGFYGFKRSLVSSSAIDEKSWGIDRGTRKPVLLVCRADAEDVTSAVVVLVLVGCGYSAVLVGSGYAGNWRSSSAHPSCAVGRSLPSESWLWGYACERIIWGSIFWRMWCARQHQQPGLIHVLLLAVLEVKSSDPCICGQSKRKRIVRIQVQHTHSIQSDTLSSNYNGSQPYLKATISPLGAPVGAKAKMSRCDLLFGLRGCLIWITIRSVFHHCAICEKVQMCDVAWSSHKMTS